MFSPLSIVLAGVISGAVVAGLARLSGWRGRSLAFAAVATVVAVVTWRLLGNVLMVNEDFMPAVSVADVGSLIAGGLAVALVAAWGRPERREAIVIAGGAVATFVVNVVVL